VLLDTELALHRGPDQQGDACVSARLPATVGVGALRLHVLPAAEVAGSGVAPLASLAVLCTSDSGVARELNAAQVRGAGRWRGAP